MCLFSCPAAAVVFLLLLTDNLDFIFGKSFSFSSSFFLKKYCNGNIDPSFQWDWLPWCHLIFLPFIWGCAVEAGGIGWRSCDNDADVTGLAPGIGLLMKVVEEGLLFSITS